MTAKQALTLTSIITTRLKQRFPNLTVEETMRLAAGIVAEYDDALGGDDE